MSELPVLTSGISDYPAICSTGGTNISQERFIEAADSSSRRGRSKMKLFVLLAATAALPLAACNNSPSDRLADRVQNAADVRADGLEQQADMLQNRAAQVRQTGEQRADAIQAADRNVATMSQEQRDAIVANQAPAVR